MLGERLKVQRNRLKLRQEDVANKIGIARTTYAMYEQNKREPDNETLQKLADFFDVTIDYLITGKEPEAILYRFNFDTGEPEVDFKGSVFRERLEQVMNERKVNKNLVKEYCRLNEEEYIYYSFGNIPPDNILKKLAELLNVTPEYLLGRTNAPSTSVTNVEKGSSFVQPLVLKAFADLSPEEIAVLQELKKYPVFFNDLAADPSKIKKVIKMWEFIKSDIENDNDEEPED